MMRSSPALRRCDMRLIRHAEMGVAIHGAVDDVDRVGAQQEIDEWRPRALPGIKLVLAHQVDEIVLLAGAEGGESFTEFAKAGAFDRAERDTIKVRVRWPHIHDARF